MAKKNIDLPAAPTTEEEKKKALDAVLAKIEKSFGKGSIMNMASQEIPAIEVIPTGSLGLDIALGVGGYPKGRIIEIYGPESSGKTTLAIHAIAECQKQGGIAAIIDAENAFDRTYAEALGVDLSKLWISQPDTGEQALDIMENLIRSSAMDLIIVDSVAALTPKGELEGDMGENKLGLHARLMSQALRKFAGIINKSNTTCIFINQLREKIGGYGNPETTTGGNALKYYASVRLDIRRKTQLKDDDSVVLGNLTRVTVAKNKVAPPFRYAEFDIFYGKGISKAGEVLDAAADLDVIRKSGSWYSYGDTKLGQGRETAIETLTENPELYELVENQVREQLALKAK
ncbi:MAG: recombinase RecA [Porphyromonas sp.]|nr:recombinase RecA [Porphyromonas sp.]